jgi:predicted AAA+ superfamily ATPase
MRKPPATLTTHQLDALIYEVREQRVMLDSDLAEIYSVPTKRLLEQVRRNVDRFPRDFAFQITPEEYQALRSQIATLKTGRGQHRKYLPFVFTEHGAIMAANVLNSPRAVQMNTTCGDAVG